MDGNRGYFEEIFSFHRSMGAFPFDRKFRLSKTFLSLSLLNVSILLIMHVDAFVNPVKYDYFTFSFMVKILTNFYQITSGVSTVTYIFWLVYKRDEVRELSEKIHEKMILFSETKVPQTHVLVDIILFIFLSGLISSYVYLILIEQYSLRLLRDFWVSIVTVISLFGYLKQITKLLLLVSQFYTDLKNLEERTSVVEFQQLLTILDRIKDIYRPHMFFIVTFDFVLIQLTLFSLIAPVYLDRNYLLNSMYLCFPIIYISPVAILIAYCNKVVHEVSTITHLLLNRIK